MLLERINNDDNLYAKLEYIPLLTSQSQSQADFITIHKTTAFIIQDMLFSADKDKKIIVNYIVFDIVSTSGTKHLVRMPYQTQMMTGTSNKGVKSLVETNYLIFLDLMRLIGLEKLTVTPISKCIVQYTDQLKLMGGYYEKEFLAKAVILGVVNGFCITNMPIGAYLYLAHINYWDVSQQMRITHETRIGQFARNDGATSSMLRTAQDEGLIIESVNKDMLINKFLKNTTKPFSY